MGKFLKLVVFVVLLLGAVLTGMFLLRKNNKPHAQNTEVQPTLQVSERFIPLKTQDEVVLESDEGVQKMQIASGALQKSTALEAGDFSEFGGLPKMENSSGRTVEQSKVLISKDKSEAVVSITEYANTPKEDGPDQILASHDYICKIKEQTCANTTMLTQEYRGLDNDLQKNASLVWFAWDSERKILLGNLVLNDLGQSSPVYMCDTEKNICTNTASFDTLKNPLLHAVVPEGAYSPSLGKFVMIVQNDQPHEQTGKTWQLLLYDTKDLAKPIASYDISAMIDNDENVSYDSVQSVSWSGDETKVAVGTNRKIFLLNLQTQSISLLFMEPIDENGDYYWDTSSLYLTPDAKFVSFIDSSDLMSSDESAQDTINVLKKVDIEKNNSVSQLFSAKGLEVKFKQ